MLKRTFLFVKNHYFQERLSGTGAYIALMVVELSPVATHLFCTNSVQSRLVRWSLVLIMHFTAELKCLSYSLYVREVEKDDIGDGFVVLELALLHRRRILEKCWTTMEDF